MPENPPQSTPEPPPETHPLSLTGANALRTLVAFYDQAIQEEKTVAHEWRWKFEEAQANGQRWLGWLQEIAMLPLGKKEEETIAVAVKRYVDELIQALVFAQGQVAGLESKIRDLTSEDIELPTVMHARAGEDIKEGPVFIATESQLEPSPQLEQPETEGIINMKISIKKINGEVIFTGDFDSIKQCVECAIQQGEDLSSADLSSADLSSANLSYADLSYADLSSADLSYADLSSANLSSANLSSANLSSANLSSANLSSADLSSANLSSANLRSADLSSAESDFLAEVLRLPNELEFLRDALISGKVNGSSYNDGECGCLAGTLARAKGLTQYKGGQITNGLVFRSDSNSPRERFFLAIKKGDTPETNSASQIALDWTNEAIAIRDNIRATAPQPEAAS